MAVKLYTLENLKAVSGLYADKALSKMNGDMEIYSTLLDKFLNQAPRTIPKLKQLLKEGKLSEYSDELKSLRIDLADIYALTLLERANVLYDAALKCDTELCRRQLEPFLQSMQSFSYELKQCRTQEGLNDEEAAGSKAAELDIGASVVNNKYSTVNKAKFIDLYGRIDGGLTDKALNLANVLKAMGYDSKINKQLESISAYLSLNKQSEALQACGKLLVMLGCNPPKSAVKKLSVMLVGDGGLKEQIGRVLGAYATLTAVSPGAEALNQVQQKPDMILVSDDERCLKTAGALRMAVPEIPLGIFLSKPTPRDIMSARELGADEVFLMPLEEASFLEKMKKYMK